MKAWSEAGTRFAVDHGYTAEGLQKTFLVITGEDARIKSNAFFEIAKSLKMPWRALRLFRIIPRPLRDAVYSLIARNRYQWFGYEENCLVVASEEQHRFVS